MGLVVLHPGASSTIQDRGRPGHRGFGVPAGGTADRSSLDLANALLANPPDAAAIELTGFGGRFRATGPLALALAGAPFAATVETDRGRMTLRIPQSFAMEPGDHLDIDGSSSGLRAYLAVRGGWRTPVVLGSRSSEARLVVGAALESEAGSVAVRRPVAARFPDPADGPIRLLDGPDGPVPAALLEAAYRVGPASDRIGLRLVGPPIVGGEDPGRASAPVAPGAVQVAGGSPLILGVAGGTMGGYPHVAHVITADLDRLGQARPGQGLRFARVGLDEARRLDRERRAILATRDLRIALAAGSGDGD